MLEHHIIKAFFVLEYSDLWRCRMMLFYVLSKFAEMLLHLREVFAYIGEKNIIDGAPFFQKHQEHRSAIFPSREVYDVFRVHHYLLSQSRTYSIFPAVSSSSLGLSGS